VESVRRGFNPECYTEDIGNKSMTSGAAMALFLNKHSTPRIVLLGRRLSDAFLVYIHPQVVEWTNNMSSIMININDFINIGLCDRADPSNSRLQQTIKFKNGLSYAHNEHIILNIERIWLVQFGYGYGRVSPIQKAQTLS